MRKQFTILLVVLTITFGWGVSRLQAQGPTPQTYSYTVDPAIPLFGHHVVKVSRDGSKEVIEQTLQQGDKELGARQLYDFEAHRVYTQDLSNPGKPCKVEEFNDPALPPDALDVISGGADLKKSLIGTGEPKQVGTETVNGIAANVMEFTSPESHAHGKVWVTQKGGFPVKIVFIDKDGSETNYIEVKQLSFAKPPASAFTLPPSCASAQLP